MSRWEKIQKFYLETGASDMALAQRFHVSAKEIERRRRSENWEGLARKNRVEQVADPLLSRLEQAAGELTQTSVSCRDKTKTQDGEQVREYIQPGGTGAVDRAGLKQLTGVLKDIKDIFSIADPAEEQEKHLRIARLEQDLDGQSRTVTVTMAEEAEDYAQ